MVNPLMDGIGSYTTAVRLWRRRNPLDDRGGVRISLFGLFVPFSFFFLSVSMTLGETCNGIVNGFLEE